MYGCTMADQYTLRIEDIYAARSDKLAQDSGRRAPRDPIERGARTIIKVDQPAFTDREGTPVDNAARTVLINAQCRP
jgi:hypothetical protein